MLTIRGAESLAGVCDPSSRDAAARTGDEPAAADAELGLPPAPLHAGLPRDARRPFSVMFLGFERPMVMLSDPAAIKALYTEREHGLPPGRNIFLEPILGSRSLLLLEGADHLAHRKLMLPAFHGERMRSYEPIVAGDRRRRDRLLAARRGVPAPPADAGGHPRGDPAGRLRRLRRAAAGAAARPARRPAGRDLLAATQLRALADAAASAAAARWARFEGRLRRDRRAALRGDRRAPHARTTSRTATTSSRR